MKRKFNKAELIRATVKTMTEPYDYNKVRELAALKAPSGVDITYGNVSETLGRLTGKIKPRKNVRRKKKNYEANGTLEHLRTLSNGISKKESYNPEELKAAAKLLSVCSNSIVRSNDLVKFTFDLINTK